MGIEELLDGSKHEQTPNASESEQNHLLDQINIPSDKLGEPSNKFVSPTSTHPIQLTWTQSICTLFHSNYN